MVGSYFNQSHLDVMTGVDYLIDKGIADPDKLIKMGWSAGGHMTNKIITHTDRFKAASSGAGAVNWIGMGIGFEQLNLSAGNYPITVTDQNNCTANGVVTINQPDSIQVIVDQIINSYLILHYIKYLCFNKIEKKIKI